MELRRRMYGGGLLPLIPITAPLNFDANAQNVNLLKIFTEYNNTQKTFAFTFSDSFNTLTLNGSLGTSFRYGYTRSGVDYVFDVTTVTNPFAAGDTKRWVIVNAISNFAASIVPGGVWFYFSKKVTAVSNGGGIYFNYAHCEDITSFTVYGNVICANATGLLTIPPNITSIGVDYFRGTSALTAYTGDIIIPSGVTIIGTSAFQQTAFNGRIEIPSSVTSIGAQCFLLTYKLTGTLTVGNPNISLGIYAFSQMGCTGSIPNVFGGKTIIPTALFSGSNKFTGDITIPSGITTIQGQAFYGMTGIAGAINLPSTITSILANAFGATSNATALNLASGYNPAQSDDNWLFNFSTKFTAISLNQSILNIAGGGNTTRTITIGATNKARLLAAFPSAETNANARGITIV